MTAHSHRTVPRRPRVAVLLPEAGSAAHETALMLAREVCAQGFDVIAIEPRAADGAALRDAGRERGMLRFVMDLPGTPDVLFGVTEVERLVAEMLVAHRVDVVHAHLAGGLTVVPLLERCWLLGIPLVTTVHEGWSPAGALARGTGAGDATRLRLADTMVRDVLALSDLVCVPDLGAPGLAGAAWLATAPRECDHTRGTGRGWARVYRTLAGPLDPPPTDLTISVIVTTYQRPDPLRDCLEALARQTLPTERFEVVVVDDGSATSAGPVVEAFRDRLDLTFVRLGGNVGLGAARNVGIEASRGDVLFFLDDDDEPAPRCLAEHLRMYAEFGDRVDAVLGWTGPTADRAADVGAWLAFRGAQYISQDVLLHQGEYDWHFLWGGRSSIRRAVLGEERFELPFCEDADLAYRLSRRELRVMHSRRAVQRVRIGLEPTALLRRAGRVGQSRAHMAHRFPELSHLRTFSPETYAGYAALVPERVGARLRTLSAGGAATLEALRSAPDPYGDGCALDRLRADLDRLAAVECYLGWEIGRRRIAARTAGRPPRLGVSITSPLLPELLAQLRSAPPRSVVLVVAAPHGMPEPAVEAAVRELPVPPGQDVEPLRCREISDLWAACDLAVSIDPPPGYRPDAHALPLPRGPLAELIQRLVHARDLVGSFR